MKTATRTGLTLGALLFGTPWLLSAQTPAWDAVLGTPFLPEIGHAVANPKDGKLYVIGGGQASGLASKNVSRINQLTWQVEGAPAVPQLPQPRCDHAAVTGIDGRIYVIAGRQGPGHPVTTAGVVSYNPGDLAWSSVPSLNTSRIKPAAAVGRDGKIYVFGGTDDSGSPILTVERLDPLASTLGWSYVMSGSDPLEMPFGYGWRATADHKGTIYLFSTTSRYSFDSATGVFTQLPCTDCSSPAGFALTTGQDGLLYRINPNGSSDAFAGSVPTGTSSSMLLSHVQPEAAPAEGSVHAVGLYDEIYDPVPAVIAPSVSKAFFRFDNNYQSAGCPVPTPTGTPSFIAAGRVKSAVSFGTNSLTYPAGPCFNVGAGSFSIDFWIRHSQTSGIKSVLDYRDSASKGYHVALYNGKILLQMAASSAVFYNSVSLDNIPVNEWTHVAFTVDRGVSPAKGTIWVNGAYSGPVTVLSGNLDNVGPMRLGKHKNLAAANFTGDLDELQIHGKALTWQEVRSIFLAGQQGKN